MIAILEVAIRLNEPSCYLSITLTSPKSVTSIFSDFMADQTAYGQADAYLKRSSMTDYVTAQALLGHIDADGVRWVDCSQGE